ncbi:MULTISPECIES: helix-turn-helix domain-containing protein [Nostocales]|uniref:Helix-turn-helix transcriptional regulator n=2 Tax=Nostocales TaxID=1161 RepID=A0ABW8WFP3_9CYAN|nr:response regulator transcription factor [Tolypothrix bouteillei]
MTLPLLLSQQDDFEQLKSAAPIDFGSLFIWKVVAIALQNQPDRLLETTDEKHLLNNTTKYKRHDRSFSRLPQSDCNFALNGAFIDVAQEVARLLQQSQPFHCEGIINHSAKTIAIRAIEPEYKQIINVEPLTEREREVLQLIIDGLNNLAIAQKLHITTGTVKSHVRNILKKLCVHNRTRQQFEHCVRVLSTNKQE